LGIAQATLEDLRQQLAREKARPKGYTTLATRGSERIRVDVTAEDVAREVAMFEELLRWAEAHCEIVPAIPKADLRPDTAKALQEGLGSATYDTLLAANGAGLSLLSDDGNLRNLARDEFQLDGAWLQPLLMSARKKRLLTQEDLSKTVAALVGWHHKFTSVRAEDLEYAAQASGWRVTERFRALAATTALQASEFESNLRVAVSFLRRLWSRGDPVPYLDACALTYALLEGINPGGAGERCAQYYQGLAGYTAAGAMPRYALTAITNWYRLHFLPPVVGGSGNKGAERNESSGSHP
jgi:hypothetical protein